MIQQLQICCYLFYICHHWCVRKHSNPFITSQIHYIENAYKMFRIIECKYLFPWFASNQRRRWPSNGLKISQSGLEKFSQTPTTFIYQVFSPSGNCTTYSWVMFRKMIQLTTMSWPRLVSVTLSYQQHVCMKLQHYCNFKCILALMSYIILTKVNLLVIINFVLALHIFTIW